MMDNFLEKEKNGSILSQEVQLGKAHKHFNLIAKGIRAFHFLSAYRYCPALPPDLSSVTSTPVIYSTALLENY